MPSRGQVEEERVYTHDRYYSKGSRGWRRPWTSEEVRTILTSKESDEQLSLKLNRSIIAIQVKRSRVR